MKTPSPQPPRNEKDPSGKPKPLILIVDDLPENLQVLAGQITEIGYEVIPAYSGPRALAIVAKRKPDLILLDIMMPGMDGFAVCQALKGNSETADIPVIFITARTDTEDIVRGFQLGAGDYITKPFKPAELIARVRNHLELKSSRDLLVDYNRKLESMGEKLRRTHEDRNRFLGIVSHDIRGAFSNVVTASRLLTEKDMVDAEQASQILHDLGMEAEHMIALSQNLLQVDNIEQGEIPLRLEKLESRPLLEFAQQSHFLAAQNKKLSFKITSDQTLIWGDLIGCRQIMANLVSNAVKYSPPGSEILIESRKHSNQTVRLCVIDQGPGLSPEDQKKLFLPYTRLSTVATSNEHSMGLGLSIVKRMAEAMNGSIACESTLSRGACFHVTLPAAPKT